MSGPDTSGAGSSGAGVNEPDEYDVIVIGAGAVGENVADYAVRGGLTATIVENELVGGECSYWACMPSKALLRTGQAVAAARRLPGVNADFDPEAVLTRRDEVASHWHDDSQLRWAEGAGVAVVRGTGRLSGVRTVTVTDADGCERTLRARQAVAVCTGSVAVTPPIPGLDQVRLWHSREATSAHQVPARLGVLGGGVVGVELAQAWAALGSRVTLLVRDPQVLMALEPIAGELVANGLRASGVDLRLETGLDSAKPGTSRGGAEGDTIELRVGDETIVVDELLVATGRRPRTTGIGLADFGVAEDRALEVDDSGQVLGVEDGWLYAAGDVTGRAPLTHQGKYAARIAGTAIAARARGDVATPVAWSEYAATADHHAVPQVVFTDPQVAAVGRTAEQAAAEGLTVRTVDLDIAVAGSYVHAVDYIGKARMVVDTEREVLVGLTFVGPDVAEMLHAATIAVVGEVPLSRLWHAVPAYPTINEVWLRLLEAYRAHS
jgi:pyruvate/2-oxoglutarate dehydrogenase complex dihydrolipoamide dehydrogenase (E3) component